MLTSSRGPGNHTTRLYLCWDRHPITQNLSNFWGLLGNTTQPEQNALWERTSPQGEVTGSHADQRSPSSQFRVILPPALIGLPINSTLAPPFSCLGNTWTASLLHKSLVCWLGLKQREDMGAPFIRGQGRLPGYCARAASTSCQFYFNIVNKTVNTSDFVLETLKTPTNY